MSEELLSPNSFPRIDQIPAAPPGAEPPFSLSEFRSLAIDGAEEKTVALLNQRAQPTTVILPWSGWARSGDQIVKVEVKRTLVWPGGGTLEVPERWAKLLVKVEGNPPRVVGGIAPWLVAPSYAPIPIVSTLQKALDAETE
jgi:hypothetical protein